MALFAISALAVYLIAIAVRLKYRTAADAKKTETNTIAELLIQQWR